MITAIIYLSLIHICFEMNGGIIENNKTTLSNAGYGGGAFYVRDATLIINDGLIQNNSSNSGGAIYNTCLSLIHI